MNGRLREDLFQWSRENKLCHLLSIRFFWPIAHDQANAFPSVPVIEIECGLAALSKLQIPVPQRSAEHHLDTILIAGTVFCDAIQIKAFLLDLQDSQCFRSGSDTDGKARAVMSVQFACFQIQFVDKPPWGLLFQKNDYSSNAVFLYRCFYQYFDQNYIDKLNKAKQNISKR